MAASARAFVDRFLVVEGVPDAMADATEQQFLHEIASGLHDATPQTASQGGGFWDDAGQLHAAMVGKLEELGRDDITMDLGVVTVHSVDPVNPKIYRPMPEDGLPSLAFPVTWDEASPAHTHWVRIRYESDESPTP